VIAGPAAAGAVAHLFVADLDHPEPDAHDRHHLERVLRLRPGEVVTVADGRGGWRVTRFGARLELDGERQEVPAPDPPLTVAFALLKGDRNELVVQKLTELGIDEIVPMTTGRCVVKWDAARAGRQHERLVTVAREAAMQCRRAWLPRVLPVMPFDAVVARPGAALADAGGEPLDTAVRVLLVGPEGGWAADERDAAPRCVALADHVLRAETAAIAGAALLAAERRRS
jgi:16S rRNA (uracil1498-N3)-methyltransferase